MIKRMLKEFMAERKTIFFYLVLMSLFMLGLSKFQLDSVKSEVCGMDAFAYASLIMAESVFIAGSLVSISINRNNFKQEKVVLCKNTSSIWNYSVIKTVIMSFVLSIFVFAVTLIFSKVFYKDFFNWYAEESLFHSLTGCLADNINYNVLLCLFFCQTFFGICVAGIVPLISFWYFKSFFLGVLCITIVNMAGSVLRADYICGQSIFYPYIIDETVIRIDIRDRFIYPILVIIILITAGSLKTKRDYI